MSKTALAKRSQSTEHGLAVVGGSVVVETLTNTERALVALAPEQQRAALGMQYEVTALVAKIEQLKQERAAVVRKLDEHPLTQKKKKLDSDIKALTEYAREVSWQFNGVVKTTSGRSDDGTA